MSDQIEEILLQIFKVEKFINHNLSLGYISQKTTVEELLEFIQNIKDSYVPIIIDIEKSIKNKKG